MVESARRHRKALFPPPRYDQGPLTPAPRWPRFLLFQDRRVIRQSAERKEFDWLIAIRFQMDDSKRPLIMDRAGPKSSSDPSQRQDRRQSEPSVRSPRNREESL